jgi:hypothetical protein
MAPRKKQRLDTHPRHRWTADDTALLIRLQEAGLSRQQIARTIGTSQMAICRQVAKAGEAGAQRVASS